MVKTFAEVSLKFVLPLYLHFFRFELVSPEHQKERPKAVIGSTRAPEIMTRCITRNRVPENIKFD